MRKLFQLNLSYQILIRDQIKIDQIYAFWDASRTRRKSLNVDNVSLDSPHIVIYT